MSREPFTVSVIGGDLVGWADGTGANVLLLHGGPGLSADYLDGLVPELVTGYRVALYQQRGVWPSTLEGPFTVATHLDDVAAVLNGLGWDKAFILGHSWGGYLALHVAVALSARLSGVLCVDPIGGVGDGGMAAFEEAMNARTPEKDRARATELDERALRGEASEQEDLEGLSLVWPAYFAHPETAPPMPDFRLSVPGYAAGYESMVKELPALESRLPSVQVPVGFVVGSASPIPPDKASRATADRIPQAWVEEIPNAGHFLWLEAPGAVRTALDRLVGSASAMPGRR